MIRLTTTFVGAPGGDMFNTLYFGGTTSGEAAAANTLVSGFMDSLGGYMSTLYEMQGPNVVELVDVATGQTTDEFAVTPFTQNGINGTDRLPHATQALLQFRTATFVNGRRLRGRMFVPGQCDNKDSGGSPTTGYLAELQVPVDALISGSTGAGGFVIYSPTHHEAGLVTTGSVWSEWAVLRSRRPT